MNEPLLLGAIEAEGPKFPCAVADRDGTILTETRIATRVRWHMPTEQPPADHPACDIEADLAYRTATRQWPMQWGTAEPSNTNKEKVDA